MILSAHPRPGAQGAGVHPHLSVPSSRGTCSNLSPAFSSLGLFPYPQNQGGRQDSWPSEVGLQTRPLCCWFTTSQVQKLRAVQKFLVLMTLLHSQAHDWGTVLLNRAQTFVGVSCKCIKKKLPQTEQHSTTEIYSLTVLGARSLKSRCYSHSPSRL